MTTLSEIINGTKFYSGNLKHYFKVVFSAKNATNAYHNFRHMLHVVYQCHEALKFYRMDTFSSNRALLVAAIFHDYEHTGRAGNDDLNIELAIRGFRKHILPHDENIKEEVERLIRSTQFPYVEEASDLSSMILRDADLTQALSVAWIQQVVFGLAVEWGTTPLAVLKSQKQFLGALQFKTAWAKEAYPESAIKAKIDEAEALLEICE